jgi:hypothetical protein
MAETKKCPLCNKIMNYDENTGFYTCPRCGFVMHNDNLKASTEITATDDTSNTNEIQG